MALLERVTTLVRANLNDLVDKAEEPEKMLKQVILDMENQLLQLKTQVAIALADQHLLERKLKENEEAGSEWTRKAEMAVAKQRDDMARRRRRCYTWFSITHHSIIDHHYIYHNTIIVIINNIICVI